MPEAVNNVPCKRIYENCAQIEQDKSERPIAGLEFAAWFVCGISTSVAIYLLWNFRIAVDFHSLLAALGVLFF